VLLHNGEPVLPFGWFSIPPDRMAEPGHAYELMQWYNAQWNSDEEVLEFLDQVVAAGTHATSYPYPSPDMMREWGQPLSEEESAALARRVAPLKDHPVWVAWYSADEPEVTPALPERCRRIREVVADEDPYHPTIMLNDTIAGIHKYVDGGDILMPDPYPCFIKGGLAAQPIEKTSEFIKACVEAGKGRKAIWATPQAFNYGDYGKQNQRGPNVVELRNQLYQAVVYGAKGFLWYTHSQTANYPDLDLGMRWLSFEVADLKDAILADAAEDIAITVEAPTPRHIHVSARRVGGDVFIFAVNTATEPQDVELVVGPAFDAASLHVVSEARGVDVAEGVFRDRFDVYETHIYTTDAGIGERESLSVPLAAIAGANSARKKPGNLAFEDSGTIVEVSSESRYGSTPDRAIDGVEKGMRWQDGTRGEFPDWLAVRWPGPVTVGRVVIRTPSIADMELQVAEGDGWRTVAEVQGNTEERIELALEAPVEVEAIRVLVTGLMEGNVVSAIWEVEAYAE